MPRLAGLFAQRQPPDLTLNDPGLAPGEVSPGANRVAFSPDTQERVMLANRVLYRYQPDPSYAAIDPQIGGAPGDPGGSSGITSQSPTGLTTAGGVPSSPYIRDYGEADWITATPTWIGKHQTIARWSNPNRPFATPDHTQGPTENTFYASPGPWAQGHYLGT